MKTYTHACVNIATHAGVNIATHAGVNVATHVGVDLHQRFCYLTALDASGKTIKQARVVNQAEALRVWLRQVPGPRQVVVEASGFWPAFARAVGPGHRRYLRVEAQPAFARAVGPEAERLVMVHPQRVKAIASARLKNDKVDSETLAHLSRADLLPEAWMANQRTQQARLLTRLRITLGQQRAKAKNRGPQRQVLVAGVEEPVAGGAASGGISEAGGARVGGQAEARNDRPSRVGNAALDHAAGGGQILACGTRMVCAPEAAKTAAGGADRAGAQTADRRLGTAASWRMLRRKQLRNRRRKDAGPGKMDGARKLKTGGWKSGKQSALPTFPPPRRRC